MLQLLMPMAGNARPFHDAGYTFPKALIELRGHPLVEYAISTVRPSRAHRFIFVVNAADVEHFHLDMVLSLLASDSVVTQTSGPTAGALCTAMLAVDHLDASQPLLVCNADQYLPDGIDKALADFEERDLDVGIITFNAVHPRWSFVRLEGGLVVEAAEKRPISDIATVGVYYYRNAGLFVRSAESALVKNSRHANQFFICPSINELILDGHRVGIHHLANERFVPLGTPGDLAAFQEQFPHSPLKGRQTR